MKLFSSISFKKHVVSCFLLFSLFLSISVLHSDETAIDLKLNVKKGDKFTYSNECDFNFYMDLPPEFIQQVKEDPAISSMTKELYITPASEAIAQKKPLIVFKSKAKDQAEVTNVSEAKDQFTLNYSVWVTNLFFQEAFQGNTINFDSENPAKNSAPADLPISFKDPKNVFPFVFKAIVDPQNRVLQFVDLAQAADKFIDNISSPFLTPDMIADIKSKVREYTAEGNKELETNAKEAFSFYPPHPVKINESWTSSLSPQFEQEWNKELAEDASEDEKFVKEIGTKISGKLLKTKSTLISRKNGIATVKVEMLNKDNVSFEIPDSFRIDMAGNFFDGTVEFDEVNGNIINTNNKTDLTVKMTYIGPADKKGKFDPQYLEMRLVGNMSSTLVK